MKEAGGNQGTGKQKIIVQHSSEKYQNNKVIESGSKNNFKNRSQHFTVSY